MNRMLVIGVLAVVMAFQPGLAWAQEAAADAPATDQATWECPAKGTRGAWCAKKCGGKWGGKRCDVAGMAKMSMPKSVVAAGDGGVVVLAGSRLLKYDADLNLVKEVTVAADLEGMKSIMGEIYADCPMCQKRADTEKPPAP